MKAQPRAFYLQRRIAMKQKLYFVEIYEKRKWSRTWWGLKDSQLDYSNGRLNPPSPIGKRNATAGLKCAQKYYPNCKYRIVEAA
jgi:hypothetical protein